MAERICPTHYSTVPARKAMQASEFSHVGWARFCAHADSPFWSRQLRHVIAAQWLQAQAIFLWWSLTGGSRF
ncbi:MAG: hypothetical protein IPN81_07760 [Nitrosomonadales bacterium]|nr:hypothetical protein [Nitrosomonadales bacterium]